MESEVFIVSLKRTPIGSFQGSLSTVPAVQLGATALAGTLRPVDIAPQDVDECIMGQVLTAGCGQAPARQAALGAGLPAGTPCMTINKVCGSGLKAVMLGYDAIRLGQSQVVLAGGQENMSLAPHLLEASRTGYRMGPFSVADSMVKDGLWDPYNNFHMGSAAELCARKYEFSRAEQDEFAVMSYERAQTAQSKGWFADEMVAVKVTRRDGVATIDADEEPARTDFAKIPRLKPAFEKDGTITAANASKINDGAAAVLLMGGTEMRRRGLKPLARIIATATHAQEPEWFTTAPVAATAKALKQAQMTTENIDLFEINEAFSVVALATMRELNLPAAKVNPHGGAIALGHPIGASGARVLTTLVHALRRHNKKTGLATLCIGGGEAVALIVEVQSY